MPLAEEQAWGKDILARYGLFGPAWQEEHTYFIRTILEPYLMKERAFQKRVVEAEREIPRYQNEEGEKKRSYQFSMALDDDGGASQFNAGFSLEHNWLLLDVSIYRYEDDPMWYKYYSLGIQDDRFRSRLWFESDFFTSASVEYDLFRW